MCIVVFALIVLVMINRRLNSDKTSYVPVDLTSFSIQALTDEQITQSSDCSNALGAKWDRAGEKSGITDESFIEADYSKMNYRAKKLNGIKTVSVTLAEDCFLSLDVDLKVGSGNVAVAIIMDGELLEIVKDETTFNRQYSVEGKHIFRVKVLAESAELEISVKRVLS